MKKDDAPQTYIFIPSPRPVLSHECSSCGYDPCVIYEHNLIAGYDESLCIERKGQLCPSCAWERSQRFVGRQDR